VIFGQRRGVRAHTGRKDGLYGWPFVVLDYLGWPYDAVRMMNEPVCGRLKLAFPEAWKKNLSSHG